MIKVPVFVVYNVPTTSQESLFPLSSKLKQALFSLIDIPIENILCCFSLAGTHLPKEKVCMTIVINQLDWSSPKLHDKNIKNTIVQKIDHVIKEQFSDQNCSEICSQFVGWPDVFGCSQDETFPKEEKK